MSEDGSPSSRRCCSWSPRSCSSPAARSALAVRHVRPARPTFALEDHLYDYTFPTEPWIKHRVGRAAVRDRLRAARSSDGDPRVRRSYRCQTPPGRCRRYGPRPEPHACWPCWSGSDSSGSPRHSPASTQRFPESSERRPRGWFRSGGRGVAGVARGRRPVLPDLVWALRRSSADRDRRGLPVRHHRHRVLGGGPRDRPDDRRLRLPRHDAMDGGCAARSAWR